MKLCDLTLATPEENLACDEALLDLCEAGQARRTPALLGAPGNTSSSSATPTRPRPKSTCPSAEPTQHPRPAPLHGRRNRPPGAGRAQLLPRPAHRRLRPAATASPPPTSSFSSATATPWPRSLGAPVEWQGQTDLAIGGLKFSGNAQRRRRRFLIFHGSFLLHLDISLLEKALPLPSREPDYRADRSHTDFLMNLKLPAPRSQIRPGPSLAGE